MESIARDPPQVLADAGERGGNPPGFTPPGMSKNEENWTFTGFISQRERDAAYADRAEILRKYTNEVIEKWDAELDTLLVFAALFSAILTAFNVESYQYLQPSIPDPTLLVLQHMSLQLNSFTTNPTSNSPVDPTSIMASVQIPMPAESWAVVLNTLWFSALVLSLTSASVSIMIKQWSREYRDGCSGASREFGRLRQYRFNNLLKWRVAHIVAALPVLLQISLLLFFAGLLVLIWHFHSTVAIILTALIGVAMLVVLTLSILPSIWSDCPYLSPQASIFFYASRPVAFLIKSAVLYVFKPVFKHAMIFAIWIAIALAWHGLLAAHRISALADWSSEWIFNMFKEPTFTTRGDREEAAIRRISSKLDIDTIIFGYRNTMHLDDVVGLVPILIDQAPDEVDGCFTHIRLALLYQHHSRMERPRNISAELGQSLFWQTYYDDGLKNLPFHQQHTILFVLSAAVIAHQTIPEQALDNLCNVFYGNKASCQSMPWHTLQYVATAIAKVVGWSFAHEVNMESTVLQRTLELFQIFLSTQFWSDKEAVDVEAFLPSVHKVAINLQQSLSAYEPWQHYFDSTNTTKYKLPLLSDTLEFLFRHDTGRDPNTKALRKAAQATIIRLETSWRMELEANQSESQIQKLGKLKTMLGIGTDIAASSGSTEQVTRTLGLADSEVRKIPVY